MRGAAEITRNAVSGAAVDFGHGAVLDPTTNNLGTVRLTRTAGLLLDDVSRAVSAGSGTYQGIDRIWRVVADALLSAAGQLTLSWLPDDDNGLTTFKQVQGWHQTAPGQPWTPEGPLINATSRSLTINPTSFSRFAISNAANPLPVTWLAFMTQADRRRRRRAPALDQAQEVRNAGFMVERSLDGHTFNDLGTVAGAGSSTPRAYTWLDDQVPKTLSPQAPIYYRLHQTDRDGTSSYPPVRAVAFAPLTAGFVVFPTRVAVGQPAGYRYTGPAQAGTLTVLNVLGQVVNTVALDGRASGPVPLQGLAIGTHFLHYTGPAGRFTSRCVME